MLLVAIEAARAAGQIIKQQYAQAHTVSYKDVHNIVSETDTAAEQAILKIIHERFSDHSIFSEEAGSEDHASDYRWIIDPLDGTTNFTHHFGHFAVSIALTHRGHIQLGVVYDPMTDELFAAEAGKGAHLNNQPLQPSTATELDKAVILMSRGTEGNEKQRHAALYQSLIPVVRSIRVLGSTALGLCYVASGRCEGFINNGCKFYDCAAGLLIASETGLALRDFRGTDLELIDSPKSKDIMATPQVLSEAFIPLIKTL